MTAPHPTYLAERDLIRRAKAGDRDAMTTLMEKWWPLLCKYAIKATGRRAEEAVGLVAIQFMRAMRSFDETKEITLTAYMGPLLARIVHQAWDKENSVIRTPKTWCLKRLSQSAQAKAIHAAKVASLNAVRYRDGTRPIIDYLTAETPSQENDRLEELRQRVARLPDGIREVMELRYRGLLLKEIGAALGYSRQRADQQHTLGLLMLANPTMPETQARALVKKKMHKEFMP